jgi:DNA polymerase elongation subunit (family B)
MAEVRKVVNAVYDGAGIVCYGRDELGKLTRQRERADLAFFLRAEDVTEAVRRRLRGEDGTTFDEREPGWVRVSCRDYPVRREIVQRYESSGLPTFEGDVSPVKRLLADRADLAIGKPRRCYLDLETDSRVPFSKLEEMRVLVWALTDDALDTQAGVLDEDSDADERELLKALMLALDPYDQICVWSGNRSAAEIFDFQVLKARLEHARFDAGYLKRWLQLSHLDCFKRMNMHGAETGAEKQSMKLDNIGHLLLGAGKLEFDASKTYEEWAAGGSRRDRLVDYCVRDVEMLPQIEAKRSYVDLHQAVCEMCGVFPDSWALLPTSFVDGFMFKLGRETGTHFRTKLDREQEPQFEGAIRGEVPKGAGVLRDVHVVDFASLYPSIILTLNISPETKAMIPPNGPVPAGHARAPRTGTGFRVEPQGILPRAVGEVMRLRKWWKKQMAEAVPGSVEERVADRMIAALKIVNNSFFGVASSQGSRFGDQTIGEAITQTGVWAISQVVELATSRALKVLSVDTDGAMMQGATREGMRDLVRVVNKELLPPLVAAMGCRENYLELDYQEEFARLVMIATGKYTAQFAHRKGKEWHAKMKPEIKGLEYIRGDSLELTRGLQGETIDLLCAGLGIAKVPVPTDDLAHYAEAIERHRKHILEDALTVDEVKISKSLVREVGDYAERKKNDGTMGQQPPQVRVAKMLKERGLEARGGMKIDYVVVDGHSDPKKIIPAIDYDGTVDRAFLWNNNVWPATERLLDAAYPGEDWKRFRVQRAPTTRKGASKPVEGQGGLFDAKPETVRPAELPAGSAPKPAQDAPGPLILTYAGPSDEGACRAAVERLAGVLVAYPGDRELQLGVLVEGRIHATLALPQRVDGSMAFLKAARQALSAA